MDDHAVSFVLSLYFSPSTFVYPVCDATRSRSNSLYNPDATLRLPFPARFFFEGSLARRASAKGRLFRPSFCIFFPSRVPTALFLKLFRWKLLLVSIDSRIQNFPITINGGDQASSSVNTQLVLQSYKLLIPYRLLIRLQRKLLDRECIYYSKNILM